jgi:hypothetical protein
MASKYIVIEMQNGNIGGNNWPYDSRADAEVKMYQVLSEVVKSPVDVHTVMLVTDEGFVLDCKCYKHNQEPEAEPETSEEA